MSILAGVGASQNSDPSDAAKEALAQAVKPLNGTPPNLIFLLSSSTVYDQQKILDQVNQTFPQAKLIGGSTAGEITSVAGSLDSSVAIMAITADQMQFITGLGTDIKADARKAGQNLAQNILQSAGSKPKAMLMIPDGLSGNGADIVRGVLDIYGQDFMAAGGSAGDDYLFKKTFQYLGRQLLSNSVVGVGFAGNFSFGVGVRHGWIPIGTPRTATKSEGNILYELDNKPAVQIYEDHFGKDKNPIDNSEPLARMAITYPLGIAAPNKDGYLIRDPLTVDKSGAITMAAEIPEGSEVHIMIGSREEAIEAAEDAVKKAMSQVAGKKVKAAFLFNCIARKKLLMSKKQEEIDHIRQVLGPEVPLIGFYTYGEQAPLGGEVVTCSFHNETDVIFLLAE